MESLCIGNFFCHQIKFLVCANMISNKALSASDPDSGLDEELKDAKYILLILEKSIACP